MDDFECGWVSGIIDAEGTIGLGLGRSNWHPKVAIDNASKEIIDRFMHLAGVDHSFEVEGTKNRKPLFVVSLRHNEIVELLKDIYPYLVIKRRQAELLLYAMHLLRYFKGPYGQARLSGIFWELRLLNAKGRDGAERVKSEMASEMGSIRAYEQFVQNNAPTLDFEESFKQWLSPERQRCKEDIELGWMAGMIDGDGTISLHKDRPRRPTRPSKRGFKWRPILGVDNTSKEALEHFAEVTGMGNITPVKSREATCKDKYRLFFQRDDIEELLRKIKDHLVKKPQAELLLEALELIREYESRGNREPITRARDKRLEAIYWELKLLNARGMNGVEKVLGEISKLPSDPRECTREKFKTDIRVAFEAMEKRKCEAYSRHLKRARKWKAKHRDEMHKYWREWHEEKKKNDPEYMKKRYETRRAYFERKYQTPEYKEYHRQYRASHRDKIREYNKQNWQRTKVRLESDPEFRERYLAEQREKQKRYQARKRVERAQAAPVTQEL